MAETYADIGYVGYGVETVEGTMVAPTIFVPANAVSFDSTNDYLTPNQLRGSRDKSIKMASPYSVSGTMGLELVPNGIGSLLVSAFAAKGGVTSGAYAGGGYSHAFIPGSSSPTFTFETSAADILVMRYGGIRVNTFEMAASFGEIVTGSFGLEGTTRGKQGSTTSESYAQVLPFSFVGADARINGVTAGNVQNFTFSVGNSIDRRGGLDKTRSYRRTLLGGRDVGLSMTMDFENANDYDLFLAETEFAVTLHLEAGFVSGLSGPKNTLVISIPRVSYNTINAALNAGDFITQDVECTIVRPLDGSPIFTATLINNEATLAGSA
jgi:hypothetical protein